MSEPDLFVVCKNCSSEVSPYVTECPYCGQRVRKRAPKIERSDGGEEPRSKRRRTPTLPRLKRDEIPGIAPDTRPYASIALVVVAVLAALVLATEEVLPSEIAVYSDPADEPWKLVTTAFVHDNLGYGLAAMFAAGLFGSFLERRFGVLTPIAVFLLAGSAGAALSVAVDLYPAAGANGAALGMLVAWLVEDRLAFRRGDDRENDMLGVLVIALLLLLMPVAVDDASAAAAAGGAAAGLFSGLILGFFRR
ncbi:MAG TPA: rhomboid family intramembrane serine protease [Thermoleophilaceae bacterium]|nr:rhomboid family intramembrane serine protease [Thermoleophilaceae bacterium]